MRFIILAQFKHGTNPPLQLNSSYPFTDMATAEAAAEALARQNLQFAYYVASLVTHVIGSVDVEVTELR